MRLPIIFAAVVIAVATLCPDVSAQDEAPNTDATSLTAAITKLTQEIQTLRAEVADLKRNKGLFGTALTPINGTAKLADGRTRSIVGIAGVREESTSFGGDVYYRMPAHIVLGDLGNGRPEHLIPIADVAAIRFSAEEKERSMMDVDLVYRNGKRQSFEVAWYDFYIDIKWSGDVPVTRYNLGKEGLRGTTITIKQPE